MEPNDQIITFETYYDPMLAHIIRTKLEAAGVQCFIADENTITLNPIYNQALNGIKLKIFAYDLEKCKAIIAEDAALQEGGHTEIDPDTQDIMVCPYCSSTNIQYIPTAEKEDEGLSFSGIFNKVFPFINNRQWRCLNCKREFD